ncbi:MAG: glycogen synthase GlgA [Xanthobacteraceae bacterium]
MRVLFASSEIYPLAKTGGLADVSGALPRALFDLGVDIHLIMPGYPQALARASNSRVAIEFTAGDRDLTTRLIEARMPDSRLPVWLVDCPALYDRPGTPYQDEHGSDWPDNAARFAHFSAVAARLALGGLLPGWRADVVHANDWHAGLLPVQLAASGEERPATLFTIHNLAYQGLFPSSLLPDLDLPPGLFTPEGIEFHGQISFLKAGIQFSDRLTTVSPSYAREILTPEHGCGLDGLLRNRAAQLSGILNGVDYHIWDPARDVHLAANYRADDLSGKRLCKAELQRELGLAVEPDIPLVVWISRITHQKMGDILLDALPELLEQDVQLALLGQGDSILETRLRDAARGYPGRMSARIGYEEALAHRFYAGGDVLLHPSRFEPCGLTPLYALRYGTLPVVRHVGGLLDTIVDADEQSIRREAANGFGFQDASARAMLDCLGRALSLHEQPLVWRKLQRIAISQEFSWNGAAGRYTDLYRELARPDGGDISPREPDPMTLSPTPELTEAARVSL